MSVSIQPFGIADVEAFLTLHRACLAYYQITPATHDQEERVLSLLKAERHMSCHLAFDGVEPVGFATWGLNFPAGADISLVMKELFISPNARRKGVGKALLSALIDVARRENCSRFDWATDGINENAQKFYAAIAAPHLVKVNYRVSQDEFDAFQARIGRK